MMKSKLLLMVTLTLLACASSLRAGEPVFYPYCAIPKWLDCRACGCPDDYVKKCLPKVCPSPCGVCDDYCQKCLPAAPCPSPCGCCDNYVAKCGPIRLSPCLPPWFKCYTTPCNACDTCGNGSLKK